MESDIALTAATLGVAVLGMLGFALFLAVGCIRGIKEGAG